MSARKRLVPGQAADKAPKERGGIQSLERAFAILEEVARNRAGINLADLSKAVGLHNSTTFHLVKTMAQLGYISHVRDSKRYRIGAKLFTLAAGLSSVIILLWPVIPGGAERALASLGRDPAAVGLSDAAFGAGVAGARVTAIPPLFPRVEGRPE